MCLSACLPLCLSVSISKRKQPTACLSPKFAYFLRKYAAFWPVFPVSRCWVYGVPTACNAPLCMALSPLFECSWGMQTSKRVLCLFLVCCHLELGSAMGQELLVRILRGSSDKPHPTSHRCDLWLIALRLSYLGPGSGGLG